MHSNNLMARSAQVRPVGYLTQAQAAKSSVAAVSVAQEAEHSESYPRIVAHVSQRWRIIACRDRVQWILQQHVGAKWRNRYFYRSKSGLLAGCHEYAKPIAGNALVILLRLPRFFQEVQP